MRSLRRTRRRHSGLLIAGVLAAALVGDAQQLLDQVVARVGGTTITRTDVEAAIALGIVDVPAGADRLAEGTRQMIDRRLLLTEVGRFPPPPPAEDAVDALVAKMKSRAAAAMPDLQRRTGVDESRIRELARDTLRIEGYLDRRFGALAQVTLQEARAYYDTHRQEFTRNGTVPPFEAVEDAARQAAGVQRRRESVTAWMNDLRTGADIVVVTPR